MTTRPLATALLALSLVLAPSLLTGCGAVGIGASTPPSGALVDPVPPDGGSPLVAPSFPPIPDGEPSRVLPQPGTTMDTHDVGVSRIDAELVDRHLYARLVWWSGVEPCNVLDSILLDRNGQDFHLTVREGSTNRDAACIEIAQLKSAIVDLGELAPGTYTVSAFGDVPPVEVNVL